jgi:hypothetical protein
MKIRNGFVSNSSSSSFVVIDGSGEMRVPSVDETGTYIVGASGETEFGWGPNSIFDTASRINFAYLQCLYSRKYGKQWLNMFENVLKDYMGVTDIVYLLDDNAYIDHQSSAEEGANTEIFDDEETLASFLFGKNSRIELDNDNY